MTIGAVNVAGLGWIQARMVSSIAAAFGYDRDHPIGRPSSWACGTLRDTGAGARVAGRRGGQDGRKVVKTQLSGRPSGRYEPDAAERGKRTVKHMGGRMIPLLGAPISAFQKGGSTKDLGKRALNYYGG